MGARANQPGDLICDSERELTNGHGNVIATCSGQLDEVDSVEWTRKRSFACFI